MASRKSESIGFKWTQQSFGWFHDAALHTDYYSRLCDVLESYMDKSSNIADLGCGAGNLGFFMRDKVNTITQIDRDQLVIENIRRIISEKKVTNMETSLCDWRDWDNPVTFDAVVISYSNGSVENFSRLRELSKRWIVIILAQSNRVDSFNMSGSVDLKKLRSRRDTIEDVVPWLKKSSIEYDYHEVNCEFGQVFSNAAEAEDFVEHYFGPVDPNDRRSYVRENMVRRGGLWYLPHMKRSGVIAIDMDQFVEGLERHSEREEEGSLWKR